MTLLATALVATLVATVPPADAADGGVESRSSHTIMAGTPYETTYHVLRGAEPGPTIAVFGGLHGNEPAGYLAARKVAGWTVVRGTLVVLPDAHAEAIRRGVRGYPANFNAMFPGVADGDDMEQLAFQVFQILRDHPADVLLTLHESMGMHVDDPSRYGQTFCYDFAELDPLFDRVRSRINADIDPERNQFVRFLKAFETCPTYQAYLELGCPGVSIETSRTLELDDRVRYQLWAVLGFLDEFGVVVEQDDAPDLSTRGEPRGVWLNGKPAPPAIGPPLPPL
jgi:predicted deacylase